MFLVLTSQFHFEPIASNNFRMIHLNFPVNSMRKTGRKKKQKKMNSFTRARLRIHFFHCFERPQISIFIQKWCDTQVRCGMAFIVHTPYTFQYLCCFSFVFLSFVPNFVYLLIFRLFFLFILSLINIRLKKVIKQNNK